MTTARVAAVGALLAAVALVAILMFNGGGPGYEVKMTFENAGGLVKGNNVDIGGKPIGTVEDIELTEDNQVQITVSVDGAYAPLHQGTTAVIRATSLSGIANRYISISPGPDNSPELAEGGVLGTDKTTTRVDLDQVFDTFDKPTRKALQTFIRQYATAYTGRGPQANRGFKYFNAALSTTQQVSDQLIRDQPRFERFVIDTSRLVTALASRRNDLAQLVGNANATSAAIAAENQALARAIGLLPGTLRQANTTFANLRPALDDLDPLLSESAKVAPDLQRFFHDLRPVVSRADPTFRSLNKLVHQNGPANDATDALQDLPELSQQAGTAFPNTITALQKGQKVIEFGRPYTPDLAGWITKFAEAAAPYDANGHYARVTPAFWAFNFNSGTNQLAANDPNQRANGLTTGQLKRCPGAASQPTADLSAPFTEGGTLDCNPAQVPPGP